MQIIQSKLLNNFINLTHCFTTKDTGNLAFHVNDNPSNVHKNHESLAQELHYNKNSLIHMKQIHSNYVHLVNQNDSFLNPQECDGLITNKKNTPLMVMVADCSPILFYDSSSKVIAVAHAGRQGAFKNIIKNTLDSMTNNFRSKPENIYVVIGASIGVCCYEVGVEIYHEASKLNLGYALEKKEQRYYLDISKILYSQLIEAGIKKEKIEISNECTSCLKDRYYSYRVKAQTGRFAGIIMLK